MPGVARAVLVAVVSTVLLGAPLTLPAEAVSAAAKGYAHDAFVTTNAERDQHDRRALRRHACLQDFAAAHARRLAGKGEIWHQDLTKVLSGCDLQFVGENVAAGYPDGMSVVEDGWMESQGHRANILERGFRRMAIAARKGEDGRWYVVQVFGRKA